MGEILGAGDPRETRNGKTWALFGRQMRFPLYQGFPLLTTKAVWFKGVVAELLWMLSGETNIRTLQEQGVHIWDKWADANGDLGPVYGAQWRSWERVEEAVSEEGTRLYTAPVDQIGAVMESLRSDPFSRRHIVSAWNVGDLPEMALPPCHAFFQFHVRVAHDAPITLLDLHLTQRSVDAFIGLPFNIASYALLLSMMAAVTGHRPGDLIMSLGDVHLYDGHREQAREQIRRVPRDLPRLHLNTGLTSVDDFRASDITLSGYDPLPHIPAEVYE